MFQDARFFYLAQKYYQRNATKALIESYLKPTEKVEREEGKSLEITIREQSKENQSDRLSCGGAQVL